MTTPYDRDTIGPLLARLRQARGYSQITMAQLLCAATGHSTISRHEVSRWEREDRIPSEYWLAPLARVLSIPIDVLRAGVDAARAARRGRIDLQAAEPAVTSWLTLQHGPRELLIALGGVEVDQFRTVLSPIRPTPMEESE